MERKGKRKASESVSVPGLDSCNSSEAGARSSDEDDLETMSERSHVVIVKTPGQQRSLDALVDAVTDLFHVQKGVGEICKLAGTRTDKKMNKLAEALASALVPRSLIQDLLYDLSVDVGVTFPTGVKYDALGTDVAGIEMAELHMLASCGCQSERQADEKGSHALMVKLSKMRMDAQQKMSAGKDPGVKGGELITLVNKLSRAHEEAMEELKKVPMNERQKASYETRCAKGVKAFDHFKDEFDGFVNSARWGKKAGSSVASSRGGSSSAGSSSTGSSARSAASTAVMDTQCSQHTRRVRRDTGVEEDYFEDESDAAVLKRIQSGGFADSSEMPGPFGGITIRGCPFA